MENDKKVTDGEQTYGCRCSRENFGPKVETKLYLKRARQMGKNLITASTQRTDSSLMAMS